MVYDDTPYYARGNEYKAEKSPVVKRSMPWVDDVLHDIKNERQSLGSPLFLWWQREDEKRKRGQDNEIDRADIIQAAKGVRNAWRDRYLADPDKFKAIVQPAKTEPKVDWSTILLTPTNRFEDHVSEPRKKEVKVVNDYPAWLDSIQDQEEVEYLPDFGQNEDNQFSDTMDYGFP